ncbi:hypothetical protein HF086_007588 [Spodoptera exigua]|uniref:Uncharacterized protein n=1 Tax=Spodoptera exigua TaxID=7107 RepID=A0A922MTJ2_SPOEX|nr:hypothetical protein HF086_007588 [Spodoptera exigua]
MATYLNQLPEFPDSITCKNSMTLQIVHCALLIWLLITILNVNVNPTWFTYWGDNGGERPCPWRILAVDSWLAIRSPTTKCVLCHRHYAMAGIELIISSICNATFCEIPYNETYQAPDSLVEKDINFMSLMKEVNGKHIKVTTYNNTPLSSTEFENGTVVGYGVAFTIMNILRKKFNFTYEIILPTKNYELGSKISDDSIIGLLNTSKVDMAVAFLPTLLPYREKVSFSIDLDEGVWVMMLKRPKESAAGSGLLAPFNDLVWYVE